MLFPSFNKVQHAIVAAAMLIVLVNGQNRDCYPGELGINYLIRMFTNSTNTGTFKIQFTDSESVQVSTRDLDVADCGTGRGTNSRWNSLAFRQESSANSGSVWFGLTECDGTGYPFFRVGGYYSNTNGVIWIPAGHAIYMPAWNPTPRRPECHVVTRSDGGFHVVVDGRCDAYFRAIVPADIPVPEEFDYICP